MIPAVFFLYQKKMFNLNSKSLLRDFGVILGCIGYMEAGEYFLNNYMWSQVKGHITSYAIKKQQETAIKFQKISQQGRLGTEDSSDLLDDEDTQAPRSSDQSSPTNK